MDLQRALPSSSSSSSLPFSSFSSSSESPSSSAASDPMVNIELEAAEALADLARLLGTRESFGGDSGGIQWGSKGKRAKKRVKSESSPPADPLFDAAPTRLSPSPASAPQNRAVADRQLYDPMYVNVVVHPANVEPDAELPKASPRCAKNYPSIGGGRSRQYLTEAEKEERRLRRILANRESARQTIRRRQALSEELTRKAADLERENQYLRMEKESALKKYQSLETENKHLKAQLSKVIKTEAEESPADLKPIPLEMHGTLSPNCPVLMYNPLPFSQLCWPSIHKTSHPVQCHHGPPRAVVIPSNILMPINGKLDSCQQEQETSVNVNGSRTPLYMVPCPWFFPLPDHSNRLHPQHLFSLKHVQDAASTNNQVSASTLKGVAAFMENGHPSPQVKVKYEAVSSTGVKVIDDLNETPVCFPPDGSDQCGLTHPEQMIPNLVAGGSVKNEIGPLSVYASRITGICTKSGHLRSAPSEKNQDSLNSHIKKLLDATLATEARRRRKELTRLKNLHGRQCRTNC